MTRDTGQTDHGRDGASWWRLVEDHLAAFALEAHEERDESAPWSDSTAGAPSLTAEQRALLAGDDQPGVPRITHPGHTPDDQPPVPRFGAVAPDAGSTGTGDAPGSTTGNIPGDTRETLS